MPKTAVTCGSPISPGKTCTNPTKHPSGKCHHHRNVTSWVDTAPGDGPDVLDDLTGGMDDSDAGAGLHPLPPEGPPLGDPVGVPVLVADGDITDSTIIAQRYISGAGHRDMLHLHLTTEGETKMVDALSVGGYKTITTQVEETVTGAHPSDDGSLSSAIATLAISLNARMKKGQDRLKGGENVIAFTQIKGNFEDLAKTIGPDDTAGQEMLAHYQAQIDTLEPYLHSNAAIAPYDAGGKIPMMVRWEGEFIQLVEKHENVPLDDVDGFMLPTSEVPGRRIKPDQNTKGQATWTPQNMTSDDAPKKMWQIDLGDGYTALYYPRVHTQHAASSGSGASAAKYAGASMRGRMTVISPKDGSAQEALDRLERLHLSSRPMTAEEAEFTYLERNIHSWGIASNAGVSTAREAAANFPRSLAKLRVATRAQEAVDLAGDPVAFRNWLRQQRLAAESESLPARAKLLRDATAKALGFSSGEQMRAHPSYKPEPIKGVGEITWSRIANGPSGTTTFKPEIAHSFNKGFSGLLGTAKSGVLASQERRKLMGIRKVLGISQSQDVGTRGASSVFCSPESSAYKSGNRIVWKGVDAQRLGERTDWYYTGGDVYGALQQAKTTPSSVSSHGQVMFPNTISLDAHPPTAIYVNSESERSQVIAALKARGLSTFSNGRTAEQVVQL